jgi:glycosyltransferase involved in cell wall biosynthesis
MPKICFVAPHHYTTLIGGAEIQNYLLSKRFQQEGWEVHHVIGDLDRKAIHQEMVLHPFKFSGFSSSYSHFYNLLNEIDADLFYQRGRNMMTVLLSYYSKQTAKPYIFATSMDIDCLKYKQVSRVFDSEEHMIKKAIRILGRLRLDRLTYHWMRSADLVLSQSSYQQEQLNRNLNIDSKIFRNVHYVPLENKIIKSSPPVVLWLSSIKKWKRPEIFLNLVKELSGYPWRFILAGRMADEIYRKSILELENKLNNFDYIENVSFEESNKLICQSSVFINTSLKYEGFPNTFIQAWLRKTPTITLDFDPDKIIETEKVGIRSESLNNLISDVKFLLNNRNERETIGSRARKFAIREFSIETQFPRFLKLANLIIKSHK